MALRRLVTLGNNDPTIPPVWIDDANGTIYTGPFENPSKLVINADAGQTVFIAPGDVAVVLPDLEGTVLITKGSAAALTLVLPTPGVHPLGHDGHTIRFVPTTAFAHTITVPANGFNGNKHILTLVPPSSGLVVAYNGVWYLVTNNAGTLS